MKIVLKQFDRYFENVKSLLFLKTNKILFYGRTRFPVTAAVRSRQVVCRALFIYTVSSNVSSYDENHKTTSFVEGSATVHAENGLVVATKTLLFLNRLTPVNGNNVRNKIYL